jgi:hypothetical protein
MHQKQPPAKYALALVGALCTPLEGQPVRVAQITRLMAIDVRRRRIVMIVSSFFRVVAVVLFLHLTTTRAERRVELVWKRSGRSRHMRPSRVKLEYTCRDPVLYDALVAGAHP